MTAREEFELACRAFDLFSLAERMAALERFAQLRYPSISDRFVEAVHSVVTRHGTTGKAEAKCDHKFVSSDHCLKCGWTPTPEDFPKPPGAAAG